MDMLIDIEDVDVNVHAALPFDDKWVIAKLKELVEMCPDLVQPKNQEAKDDILKVLGAVAAAPDEYRDRLMAFHAVATRKFAGSNRLEKSHIALAWFLANIHGYVTTEWVYEALNDLYGAEIMAEIARQLGHYEQFADRFINGHHRGLLF
jgi:hypothetical protein